MMRHLAIASLLFGAACVDEVILPAPVDGTGGGGGAGGDGGTPLPGPQKRTVESRAPWAGPVGNLFADGDVEHSITLEGVGVQSGLVAFDAGGNGQIYIRGETGGICRTGLRCGVVTSNMLLLAKGVSAKQSGMRASVWMKPPAERPECNVFDPYLFHCDFSDLLHLDMAPVALVPDADGWCEYSVAVAEDERGMCMLVENTLFGAETGLIDAAVMLPDDGTAPQPSPAPMSGDRSQRVQRLGRTIRNTTPIGRLPRREPPVGDR
jgi:hypothetical protein